MEEYLFPTVFCQHFCVAPREEGIFASVPIVLELIGQANDFCLYFEKGLKWCVMTCNMYVCSGLD